MLDGLIEELPTDVSRLVSFVLHSAGKRPRPRRLRRCRQTGGPTAVRHLTHLREPQSAAGIPALVPDHQADQPRLAGMDVLLGQTTLVRSQALYLIVPGASLSLCGLLADRL